MTEMGRLMSSDPEQTYQTCRELQKGNYDKCDACQFRFKCWTAGEPRALVYTVGQQRLADALNKIFKKAIDDELLNILYDGAK